MSQQPKLPNDPSGGDNPRPRVTPSRLKPVPADYEPAYPQRLTDRQIEDLLRPGLFRRFGPATLLAGAVIAGTMAAGGGCDNASPAGSAGGGAPDNPAGGGGTPATTQVVRSTRTDPRLKGQVDQVVAEILGATKQGFWNEHASLTAKSELSTNPAVKYPRIPISYGNSYCGVFDTEAAKAATAKLFAAYGLELEPNVRLKGDGFEFVADGYDKQRKVGFKLVTDDQRVRFADRKVVKAPPGQALEDSELPALDKAVGAGELKVFMARAEGFPNMDNDLFTPMQYYLASVVDYLNWVHGDRQIDPATVLGEPPGADRRTGVIESTETADGVTRATVKFARGHAVKEDMQLWVTDEGGGILGHMRVEAVEGNHASGRLEGPGVDKVGAGNRVTPNP